MAISGELHFDQSASLGDDPFGDPKTAGGVLAIQSIRINPGEKTMVISFGIYNADADYLAGERPIWRTGISINATEYHPSPGGAAEWTYAAYRPGYADILPYLEIDNATNVFRVVVEDTNPDIRAWVLLQPSPNDTSQTLDDFFNNGALP
jgi:hypothetical protein